MERGQLDNHCPDGKSGVFGYQRSIQNLRPLQGISESLKGAMTIVNFDMLRHPINWFSVTLMVFIAAMGLHLVLTHYSALGASAPTK
jgi:hypothetical protein